MSEGRRKKRSNTEDSPQSGGWEIVYTSFILILLAFFIMLSAFGKVKEQAVMQFVESFVDAVTILSGGVKLESGGTILKRGPDIVNKKEEIAALMEEAKKALPSEGDRRSVEVFVSEKGVGMRLSGAVVFPEGVAEISPKAEPLLGEIASIIKANSLRVRIEGHTDDIPIHNDRFPSNWELSTARAVNVLKFLMEEHNIPENRLCAAGFGEFQPLYPNDSPEHRKKNRRVEIVFLKKGAGPLNEEGQKS